MNWKKEVFSIPNILTYIRLLLIPAFLYVYFQVEKTEVHLMSTGILAVSTITDALDGFIARRFNMITQLGKMMDPIADKFLQFALACTLMVTYPTFFVVLIIMAVEDMILMFGGYYVYDRTGKHLGQARMPGKVATAVFFVFSIILIVVDLSKYMVSYIMIGIMGILVFIATCFYSSQLITLGLGGGIDADQ